MSTYTPNLDLLKKDPTTEGSDLFNIGTMLNDNWDKVDAYTALVAASIAPIYSTSSAYSVGDYCTHGGKLYRCTSDIGSGGEAWNDNHWTAVDIETLLAGINSDIAGKAPTNHAASATTYGKGDGTNYGHLKLSDATDDSSDADGGIAATPKAVKAVENTKADKTALATFVRPNLLDNWYFVGGGSQQGGGEFPINSKGQTSYTTHDTSTVDRWILRDLASVAVNADYITLTSSSNNAYGLIWQPIIDPQKLIGKTVTTSILCRGSNSVRIQILNNTKNIAIARADATVSSSVFSVVSSTATVKDTDISAGDAVYMTIYSANPALGLYSQTLDVVAVKLELGDTQTLAHQENGVWVLNEIPDYNEQMLRCNEGLGQYAQVEYGSYTGTGTYGSGNANSLTFSFVPKFLLVKQEASSSYSIVAANGLTSVYSDYSTSYSNTMTWSDKTVTWYSTNAARQLNTASTVYHYVAFG